MKDFVAITRRPSGQKKTLGASLGAPSGRANDFFAGTRRTEWSIFIEKKS